MRTGLLWKGPTLFVVVACTLLLKNGYFDAADPPRRIAVWKSHDLPFQSKRAVRSWPGTPFVVTDTMCGALAKRNRCTGYFRADIMNIMRADACRYMALHEFGGVYADLDVVLNKPLNARACPGLCVGYEYDNTRTFSNYFMMAQANSTCLKRVITQCCQNLGVIHMDFKKDPHLIHNSCGPNMFTEVTKGCVSHVMSHHELTDVTTHEVASTTWGAQYPSWARERMKRAGWKHVYEH